jgi:acyl-CoA thioesterase-1
MRFLLVLVAMFLSAVPGPAGAVTVLALGDSLTAGYGLPPEDAFPVKLEAALRARGHDVTIVNGGVSGDTAADGLARLDWALSPDVDAVIVELGANDALRGLSPAHAEAALDGILAELAARRLPVLLAGMVAPPNLGSDYGAAFNGIYGKLSEKHGSLLYPFFLDGVAADPGLNQEDGMHPNAKGVDLIVARMLPMVEALLSRIAAK